MNFSFYFLQFLVLFVFILKYYHVYAGHKSSNRIGNGHSGRGHGHRQHLAINRNSIGRHSQGRNFGPSKNGIGRGFQHTSPSIDNFSGRRTSGHHNNYINDNDHNRHTSRNFLSDRRHSSKTLNRNTKITNQVLHSSKSNYRIHNSYRNEHISSNSLNFAPTVVNNLGYTSPVIGVGGFVPGIPNYINTFPAVALDLAPNIVNIQPGFSGVNYPPPYPPVGAGPGYYDDDDYPPAYANTISEPYLNPLPNQRGPRCYETFRQITSEGTEVIIIKFYSLDELYLQKYLGNYRNYNKGLIGHDYPCDYYLSNIR